MLQDEDEAEEEEHGEREDEEQDDSEQEEGAGTQTSAKKKKKNKRKKKKKAKPADEEDGEGGGAAAAAQQKGNKTPQGQAKLGKSAAPAKDVGEMSMDEFDKLLASSGSGAASTSADGSAGQPVAPVSTQTSKLRSLLSCTTQHFDPMVELKRNFGAAAVRAYEAEAKASSSAAAGGSAAARAQARMRSATHNPNLRLRSVLVQPKPEWPPIAQTFTGMSMDDRQVDGHGKACDWKHSRAYKEAQYNFLDAARSFDPNSLYALFRIYPWHIDTLLQLSEVLRHQGDLGQAGDFVARALFAYERCASPGFVSSLTSTNGPAFVDFRRIENRGFYLAAHRHVNYLGRRGTWRTALEWCKLLFAMHAPEDKHGALLWIDFLAIKANCSAWFLELDSALEVDHLPGWQYARALAERDVERKAGSKDHSRSDEALAMAIRQFPVTVPILLKKIGADLPMEALDDKLAAPTSYADAGESAYAYLLSHLYAARSDSLWKEFDHSAWLSSTFKKIWPTMKDDFVLPDEPSVEDLTGVYRHVIVSDIPDALRQQLISYIPHALSSRSELLDASDPFAPPNGTRYDDNYFADVSGRLSRGRGGDQAAELERMIAALEQNVPEAERGNFLADLLGNMMPGGFRGEEGEEEDDDDDGEQQAAGGRAPEGLMQRMMAYLQQARGQNNERPE